MADVSRGKPKISRQEERGSSHMARTRVSTNPKVVPVTKQTWCRDHSGPETYFGIISRMYRGVMQLMQPMISPCVSLTTTRV